MQRMLFNLKIVSEYRATLCDWSTPLVRNNNYPSILNIGLALNVMVNISIRGCWVYYYNKQVIKCFQLTPSEERGNDQL